MVQPDPVANDNRPALARHVPIVGVIAGDGAVIITDPTWRPTPQGDPASAEPPLFPNDAREA